MGTIPAQTIVDQASVQLLDEDNVRWAESELLGYLNDGQRQVVLYRPEAGAVTLTQKLAAGTRQALPASAHTLLDVKRNMGTDGTTPGRAIRVVSGEVLDVVNPFWHGDKPVAVVRNYIYDPRVPLIFYVTPPQPASAQGYVELEVSAIPGDVALAEPIKLDDIYGASLLDYVLYRAYGKDSEYGAELQLAAAHASAFLQALGIFTKEQMLRNPNLMPLPINPQVPAQAR